MAVPYTFANATSAIPLSQLDNNFATPVTIGNVAIQLGNTVSAIGNVTLNSATLNNSTAANVTISSVSTPITVTQGGTGNSSAFTANAVVYAPTTSTTATSSSLVWTGSAFGIGESSPGSKLEVSNTVNTAYDPTNTLVSGQTARITNLSTTSGVASTLFFKTTGSGGDNSYATISCVSSGTGASVLTFGVKVSSGNSPVEAMRITPSGQLILNPNGGTAPPFPALWVYGGGSGTQGAIRIGDSSYPSNGSYWNIGRDNNVTGNFTFSLSGTQKGYIDGTTGSYVAVSDSRLKNNITNITYGLDEILRLRPVMYNMNDEKDNAKKHIGLIAQEVKAVIDESVDDLIDESQQFYGLDKSGLVPVLVKAIQELNTTITSLIERITALEAK